MFLYIFLVIASFYACNDNVIDLPCAQDPCDSNACKPENCVEERDSTFLGLDTLWSIQADVIKGSITKIIQSDQHVFLNLLLPQGYDVLCFSKDDGSMIWRYNSYPVDRFDDMHYDPISNRIILQQRNTVLGLDPMNGNLLTEKKVFEGQRNRTGAFGKLLNGYYYIPMETNNRSVGGAVRSKTTDLLDWEWAYRITQQEMDGIEPSTDSYNLWIHPGTGDEILLLQHRTAFPRKRIDLVAYNMTADTMYWWHKDIEPDGNSNIGQIAIVDGKALFQGSQTLHCYDIESGNFEWKIQYNGSPNRSYMSAFANIVDMKNGNIIATVKERSQQGFDDKYITQIIDLNNGNIVKELDIHTGYINRVYLNGYLFGSGKERIVDPNSGNVLWNEVDNNNLGVYDILIDEERKIYFGIYGGIVQDDARLMAWDISEFLE